MGQKSHPEIRRQNTNKNVGAQEKKSVFFKSPKWTPRLKCKSSCTRGFTSSAGLKNSVSMRMCSLEVSGTTAYKRSPWQTYRNWKWRITKWKLIFFEKSRTSYFLMVVLQVWQPQIKNTTAHHQNNPNSEVPHPDSACTESLGVAWKGGFNPAGVPKLC